MVFVFSWLMLIACVECVVAPSWRRWEEIAVEKSCKRHCISCRVLNSGDVLTSSDRSWSLTQGALLCKCSAGEINTPHKRAKQSYLLQKSSKRYRSGFLTRIERKTFWFRHSHWWKLLEKAFIYNHLFQSEWLWAIFHCLTCALEVLMSLWMNPECCSHSAGLHRPGKLWFCHASPVSLRRTASADRRTSLSEAAKASAEREDKKGKHLIATTANALLKRNTRL